MICLNLEINLLVTLVFVDNVIDSAAFEHKNVKQ